MLSDLFFRSLLTLIALPTNRLSVLVYHRILDQPDPLYPFDVTASEFESHIEWIAKTFNVISLTEASEHLRTGTLPPRSLCITFDDGYASVLTKAAPILGANRLPATVFICSSCLHGAVMWNDRIASGLRHCTEGEIDLSDYGLGQVNLEHDDRIGTIRHTVQTAKYFDYAKRQALAEHLFEIGNKKIDHRMLNADEAVRLFEHGLDIGCHTVTHPILARVDDALAQQEIVDGKHQIEAAIGRQVEFFAYPNGKAVTDYSAAHTAIVREAGYTAACTTEPAVADNQTDRFQIPRFTPWDKTRLKFLLRMSMNQRNRPSLA